MKILIFSDMEGISGICLRSQVAPTGEMYAEGRRYMTADVNACIQGCVDGGAETVVVRDVHWGCNNLIWHELDERAECIQGRPGLRRFTEVNEFDAIILLGYHAMAGTLEAILEHTGSTSWQNCWLNGEKVGEFALDAARAGEHGLPVIMTSGDDKLCAEAKALINDVVTVEVKKGLSAESGRLLAQKIAHQKIRTGAAEAVRTRHNAKPFIIKAPITVRLEVVERTPVPSMSTHVKVLDARTIEVTGNNVEETVNLLNP